MPGNLKKFKVNLSPIFRFFYYQPSLLLQRKSKYERRKRIGNPPALPIKSKIYFADIKIAQLEFFFQFNVFFFFNLNQIDTKKQKKIMLYNFMKIL